MPILYCRSRAGLVPVLAPVPILHCLNRAVLVPVLALVLILYFRNRAVLVPVFVCGAAAACGMVWLSWGHPSKAVAARLHPPLSVPRLSVRRRRAASAPALILPLAS